MRCQSDAKEVKLSLGNIEENGRSFVDRDPGQDDVDDQEKDGEKPTGQHEFSRDIRRMENVVGAIVIDRGDTVEIGKLFVGHGGKVSRMAN